MINKLDIYEYEVEKAEQEAFLMEVEEKEYQMNTYIGHDLYETDFDIIDGNESFRAYCTLHDLD
jgi:hypothetical protein